MSAQLVKVMRASINYWQRSSVPRSAEEASMEQQDNDVAPRTEHHLKEPRFEFIPFSMRRINARAILSEAAWTQISKIVRASYGWKCCECGNGLPLDCHEVWKYEWVLPPGEPNKVGTMRLTGLQSLCRLCHRGKHLNFELLEAGLPKVKAHLMRLYGLSESHLERLVHEALNKLDNNSLYRYLDLTYLNNERFDRFRELIGHHYSARLAFSMFTDEQLVRRLNLNRRPGSIGRSIRRRPLDQPAE
jgi:hypothetical protein